MRILISKNIIYKGKNDLEIERKLHCSTTCLVVFKVTDKLINSNNLKTSEL